jgi:hypothetical protein
MALLSGLVFGPAAWVAFVGSVTGTADRFLMQGAGLGAMQSVYALAVPWFGSTGAIALHAAVALAALLTCLVPWRRGPAAEGARAAAAIAAAFLATPYVFNHDAPMLVIAALLLARGEGVLRLSRLEGTALCLAVLLPAITLFTATNLPGPLAAAITLAVARRQAARALPQPAPGNAR